MSQEWQELAAYLEKIIYAQAIGFPGDTAIPRYYAVSICRECIGQYDTEKAAQRLAESVRDRLQSHIYELLRKAKVGEQQKSEEGAGK